MASETKTIMLEHPITVDGDSPRVIDRVNLTRAKGKHLRAMAAAAVQNEVEQALVMISSLTGLSPAEVDELDAVDITTIAEAAEDFLPQRAIAPVT